MSISPRRRLDHRLEPSAFIHVFDVILEFVPETARRNCNNDLLNFTVRWIAMDNGESPRLVLRELIVEIKTIRSDK